MKNHTFVFNVDSNGGESLFLNTNVDEDSYSYQVLTLVSYANSASFNLNMEFTPDKLRKLADELEEFFNKIDNERD